ncbi:MAG: trypsin-like peptidase domain-containing protein [Nitrospinae bacterium]|nr:trypsin-like peptidase domain-containing protein [Nitrospinota bacterium]
MIRNLFNRQFTISSFLLVLWLLFVSTSPVQVQGGRLTEDEQNTIEIFKNANRGVVHINVRVTNESRFEKHELESDTGTGFIIDKEGYILTNFHMVKNMNQIDVILGSGSRLSAVLVGTAPQLDIALLKADDPQEELFPLPLGDSNALQIGQKVIAIGNPLGLHNTITVGVVSALRRSLEDSPLELRNALIQTDAAINPGNSGGPLLNSSGEVVGINTAIAGNAQNLGFAIPINFARRIIPDLIKMGHPYQPQLGFSASEITPSIAKLFGLPLERGLLVEEVMPGSPAALAGLRGGERVVIVTDRPYILGGDIVTEVNGKELTSLSELVHILLEARPNQVILLNIYRRGQKIEIPIKLVKMQMQF